MPTTFHCFNVFEHTDLLEISADAGRKISAGRKRRPTRTPSAVLSAATVSSNSAGMPADKRIWVSTVTAVLSQPTHTLLEK